MSASKTTAIIGLTGGIACGKSTVSSFLSGWGAHIVDADAIAREVVAPGEPALNALVRAFGSDILQPDGSLDRQLLGRRVFGDKAAIAQLNAITHPAIGAATGKRLADAQRAGRPWVIYEAALILENKIHTGMSGLIVVLCSPEVQLARLLARSFITRDEALARIGAQTTDEARRAAATWVIENDGGIAALEAATRAVFDDIVARHGPPLMPSASA